MLYPISFSIPECMPKEYKRESVMDAYQMYYMMEKMVFNRLKELNV